jgi:hypothetical protein
VNLLRGSNFFFSTLLCSAGAESRPRQVSPRSGTSFFALCSDGAEQSRVDVAVLHEVENFVSKKDVSVIRVFHLFVRLRYRSFLFLSSIFACLICTYNSCTHTLESRVLMHLQFSLSILSKYMCIVHSFVVLRDTLSLSLSFLTMV